MASMILRVISLRIPLAAALVAVGLALLPAAAAPNFPALTGRVVDDASLLSPEDERRSRRS